MEEEKRLQDERIDAVATLEKFKEECKSMYYGYYVHKYPDSSYLQYLELLKTMYSRKSSELNRFIHENTEKIPDWVIEKKEEAMWLSGLVFDQKLLLEYEKILQFIYDEYDIENGKLTEQERYIKKITDVKVKKQPKLSNSKKLALLQELGIFDLPKMKKLSDNNQNEIIGLLLDAHPKEFVYKNRLNINSKDPNYQIDKYTSYQYLDEMKTLLNETD